MFLRILFFTFGTQLFYAGERFNDKNVLAFGSHS